MFKSRILLWVEAGVVDLGCQSTHLMAGLAGHLEFQDNLEKSLARDPDIIANYKESR
jgi:hypothetical protein